MRSIHAFDHIFIHRLPVDMRKQINGLSIIASEELKLDLKASSLFVFTNKPRTLIKILYFDRSTFALWLKRLEGAEFPWPRKDGDGVLSVGAEEMDQLLEGINIWTRFKSVDFKHIV